MKSEIELTKAENTTLEDIQLANSVVGDEAIREQRRSDSILRANRNYIEICNYSCGIADKKYQYLPFWKEKESKLLLRELKRPRKYFNEYKRGTIIRVDFGVNIGCEFSQIHYAIVLNKKDNRLSETISVIPLTSKDKNSNLNIGNVIFDNAMSVLNSQLSDMIERERTEKEANEFFLEGDSTIKFFEDLEKLKKVLEYYSINPISSFACYKNIITISKSRIQHPINEFDFINKTVCDERVMEKIDKAIIKYYTNIKF